MTLLRACTASTAIFLLAVGWLSPALAQTTPEGVIALVNTGALLRDSDAGRSISEQVEQIRVRYQQEVDRREQQLRAEEEELRRQQTILSPEAFAERRQQFQNKVANLQIYVRDSSQLVDEAVARAVEEVRRTISLILDDLQAEHGYNLVLDTSQVVYGQRKLDLTPLVLEELNKRLPSVSVQLQAQQ